MSKKTTRSSRYQSLFLEASYSNDMMESFSNEDSIQGRLNPWNYDEELLDLEDQLKVEFWRIVNTLLTTRQKEVLTLTAEGYTQMEIAKRLGVNQSSIVKSISGNSNYKNINNNKSAKSKKKVYGGAHKKIRKIIEDDESIKKILERMAEIREERW